MVFFKTNKSSKRRKTTKKQDPLRKLKPKPYPWVVNRTRRRRQTTNKFRSRRNASTKYQTEVSFDMNKFEQTVRKSLKEVDDFVKGECLQYLEEFERNNKTGDYPIDYYESAEVFLKMVWNAISRKSDSERKQIMGIIYGSRTMKEFKKKCKDIKTVHDNLFTLVHNIELHYNKPKVIDSPPFNEEDLARYRDVFLFVVSKAKDKLEYARTIVKPYFELSDKKFEEILFEVRKNNDADIKDSLTKQPMLTIEKKQNKTVDLLGLDNKFNNNLVVDHPQQITYNPNFNGLVWNSTPRNSQKTSYSNMKSNKNVTRKSNKNANGQRNSVTQKGVSQANNLKLIDQIMNDKKNKTNH